MADIQPPPDGPPRVLPPGPTHSTFLAQLQIPFMLVICLALHVPRELSRARYQTDVVGAPVLAVHQNNTLSLVPAISRWPWYQVPVHDSTQRVFLMYFRACTTRIICTNAKKSQVGFCTNATHCGENTIRIVKTSDEHQSMLRRTQPHENFQRPHATGI